MRICRFLVCFLVFPFGALHAQIKFQIAKPDVVRARLDLYKGSDAAREVTLRRLFSEAGCADSNLSEQKVPHRKEPNVICVLPGMSEDEVLVGAHFDHVSDGSGIVDNWSGASLLPSLFQSLLGEKREKTYVFVGFTGEEAGELGSLFYVSQLSDTERGRIRLMITIDTLGLGPTKVWASRSDPQAVDLLAKTAEALKLPIAGMNVDGVGVSDEESFLKAGVKTVTVHSLTTANLGMIHSSLDAPAAIRFQDYYDTYHLLAGYLAVLDHQYTFDSAPKHLSPD
jgi:aminopeptidase-like protein